jgi:hypothetical protein
MNAPATPRSQGRLYLIQFAHLSCDSNEPSKLGPTAIVSATARSSSLGGVAGAIAEGDAGTATRKLFINHFFYFFYETKS